MLKRVYPILDSENGNKPHRAIGIVGECATQEKEILIK